MPCAKRKPGTIEQKRITVWLILGPSGAGKSSFGEWLAAERNWLYMEIDRYPKNGIDLHKLRAEWNDFYVHGNPKRLGEAVQQRLKDNSKSRGVLTFPGNLVLSPDHMVAAAQVGIRTIYLYGSADHCITTFLNRERQNGRNFGLDHWVTNNCSSYMKMSEPAFAPYRIHVFTHISTRRPHVEVFEALLKGEESE